MRSPDRPDQDVEPDTPVAVALAGGDAAPRVTASGRGLVAEQILALAFEHGVRVREDADLAQLLSLVEVGDEIPAEAFVAVAEVLSYVYRANGQTAGSGVGPLPSRELPP